MAWDYNSVDSGITLFTACLKAGAPIAPKPGSRVLEACCCENDFLQRAAAAWPDCGFIGIDQGIGKRSEGPNWERYRQDILEIGAFPPASFDAVISLSAIEHIGLGHYGDPKDADGDSKAVSNIWTWLRPGGVFYFDVPYNPEGYSVLGTECRIYDDLAIENRLKAGYDWEHHYYPWQDVFRGYVDSKTPGTLVERPTKAAARYWYVAMCWQKAC